MEGGRDYNFWIKKICKIEIETEPVLLLLASIIRERESFQVQVLNPVSYRRSRFPLIIIFLAWKFCSFYTVSRDGDVGGGAKQLLTTID